MTDRTAGEVLDPLGVMLDVDDDQQVTECVVIARCVSFGEDNRTALIVASSPGLDWISQGGLLSAADRVLRSDELHRGDEDDG